MEILNQYEVSNLLDVSVQRLIFWSENGKLKPVDREKNIRYYNKKDLLNFNIASAVFNTKWDDFIKIKPLKKYKSIELFAGAGGMVLGIEKAGIEHILLNEVEKNACETLKCNRPDWNIIEDDISNINFTKYINKADIVTGGFPC